MRTLVLFALFAVAFASFLQSEFKTQQQFAEYVRKYNKQYESHEIVHKYENFKASLKRVDEKNKRTELAGKGATYGLNKFSDLSPEEFRSTVLMTNKINPSERPERPTLVPKIKASEAPATYDWRDHGAVTAVKDQEQCGSCWAFSVTENVESMWILAGKASDSIALAPQQIVDCDDNDDGCDGGNPNTAYEYLLSAGGLESEAAYPYTGEDGNCAFKKSKVIASIENWMWAADYPFPGAEEQLQGNLLSYGPLSICVDAASWQDYQSGVLSWEECAIINELDHCVQLVGYNATDSSNSYWIVRNSWNTDWGIEGYIWLEMWEDTCGLTHEASTSLVNNSTAIFN